MDRMLGLDLGEKRIGVAVSDASHTIASPLCVLDAADLHNSTKGLPRIIEDYAISTCVCGLPTSLSGEDSAQARSIQKQAQELADIYGFELIFQDERYTSKAAQDIAHERGYTQKDMRGKLDMIAASLILQTYLDRTKNADRA